MYTDYFGLKQAPFSIAPDPRYLFMSDRHREALAHLLYGVNGGGGFVLLTGEIGAGKTTVCRAFLEQVPKHCHVAYIFNPKLTAIELLQTACEEFGIAPTSDGTPGLKAYIDTLNAFLLQSHARSENCVLIIDEAQNLSLEVLEQLRLLTNLETSERKLLQIILIGQPELRDMLMRPDMEQMAQRVIARYHLAALTPAETAQYVAHRLAVSGWHAGPLFDAKALKRIHELTHGIPRRINVLCDRALLGAYATGQKTVGTPIANKAAAELFDELPRDRATKPPRHSLHAAHLPMWFWGVLGGIAMTCVATAGMLTYWHYGPHQVQPAVVANAPLVMPAPSTVQAASTAPATQVATLDKLNAWMEGAPTQNTWRWQALARLWQIEVSARAPCQAAKQQGVQCFQSAAGLDLIRQLDRPSALGLFDRKGRAVFAVLTRLNADTATLQYGEGRDVQRITVTLSDLAKVWRGDFFTLWRSPEGYQHRLEAGQSGQAVTWLAQHLAQWRQQPPPEGPQRYEPALQAQVHAFQITQGIKPDGIAGAMTLMQLNRLTGVDEPRLNVER
jgi:general secretion pathway protein A